MRSSADTFDLSSLTELSEESVCRVLRDRYEIDRIYTLVGDILIFMNPFKPVNIYTEKEFACFSSPDWGGRVSVGTELDSRAHIYSIGRASFTQSVQNSSILISGESGAGKTESTKLLLQQFVRMAGASKLNRKRVAECLLAANPIMEAFGNARTTMNHNSSRFAKFVSIGLQDTAMVSSEIHTYMLEKSRLIGCTGDEGNFHIFYYYCLSEHPLFKEARKLEDQKQQQQQLPSLLSNLRSLGQQYNDLEAKVQELASSFDTLGFSSTQKSAISQIIGGLLQLGNLQFTAVEQNHSVSTELSPASEQTLKLACKLLGISDKDARKRLVKTLTSAKIQVNEEDIYSMFHEDKTRIVLHSCIKAVYARLFDWIIRKINDSISSAGAAPTKSREIGVLDIFGFESLTLNSFEQLCINLANEQLQLFFTRHVIELEQQEYRAEGLSWTEITFEDNHAALELFLEKPVGLLSLLNEESSLESGNDESLYRKMLSHLSTKPRMQVSNRSTSTFVVQHYAGEVTYTIPGLVDKNRDRAPQPALDALASTKNKVLVEVLAGGANKNNEVKKKKPQQQQQQQQQQPLAVQFRTSLDFLLKKLNDSQPFFVRCIKPNRKNAASRFDEEYVTQQIRYCGIAEAVRVRRAGFATRCPIANVGRLFPTIFCFNQAAKVDDAASIRAALRRAKLGSDDFAIGKTKLFLKSHASEKLQEEESLLRKKVVTCQKLIRGFLQRRRFQKLKKQRELEIKRQAEALQSRGSLLSDDQTDESSKRDTIRWFRDTQRQQVQNISDYHLWFHGIISRQHANDLLAAGQLGCFLLRVSNTRRGFVLSFRDADSAKHYLVDQLAKGKFQIVGEKTVHRSLSHLVEYHKKYSLRHCTTKLTQPIGQEREEEPDYCELFLNEE